ncbi:MAG: NAD-binding protein [Chloroflexi bacterium]|nr:NAD-binding protein [Chloroflexota bacterium]
MKKKGRFRRQLRAQLRDIRVLLGESGGSMLLFVLVVLGGAAAFHLLYTFPVGAERAGESPRYTEAVYATFSLIFFETLLPFPEEWYLQALFFIIPVVGLVVVADGVLRFSTALINKQARGQKWQVAMASTYSDHIIVCGAGKIGYRVTEELLKYGRDVVAIEMDENGRFVEKVRALGVPLLIGDARRSENIIKAGIQRADAIIPCTDNELANLDIALDAREINPNIKVVLRMFDSDLARRVEKGFGIHTAFSGSALAAPIFAAAAMRLDIKHSFYVGEELLNLSEMTVRPNSPLAGWTVNQLQHTYNLSVVFHRGSAQDDMHPDPEQKLCVGDFFLVLASLDVLRQIKKLNGDI